ncbi:MAG: hypothetical protein EOO60_05645 [Hymenobacter sp.]|nr:MAG: hypothetical protein EOO60_05645 [Hymenobacter sp.]
MKKLLLFGACLVALASQPVKAQVAEPAVITVQVYTGGVSGGYLLICRGEGKTEEIPFKSTKRYGSIEAYQRALAKLCQEGYTLKGTFAEGSA